MTRTIYLVALLLLGMVHASWAENYYVSPSGVDAAGASACTTEEAPCQTIQRAILNAETGGAANAGAGDTVFIMNGTYTAGAVVLRGGSPGQPFTIKNYPGHAPVMDLAPGNGFRVCAGSACTQTIGHIVVEGLEIKRAVATGFKLGSDAAGGSVSSLTVRHMHIHHNGTGTNGGIGILGSGNGSGSIIVEYNNVHHNGHVDNKDHGIYMAKEGLIIRYNTVWANHSTGMQLGGIGCHVYGNTIAYQVQSAGIVSWNGGSGVGNGGRNCIYENNAFYQNQGGAMQFFSSGSGNIVRNNFNYATSPRNTAFFTGSGSEGPTYTSSNNTCMSGCAALATDPNFVSAPVPISTNTPDFTLTSSSTQLINTGTTLGGAVGNGTPDRGAFEAIGTVTTASASGNTVEVTVPMSVNVPVQPATGQTTWVVKFSGVARNTVSAVKKTGTDSVVQITYDGAACNSSDVMTVDYTSGNVTDSANIGHPQSGSNQKLFSFTGLAVNESACTGGGGGSPPPPSANSIIYDMNNISGTTVPDTSGNALDGTTSGSPTVVTGLIDDALSFADQVDDFITAPHGSGINPTTQSGTYCILVSLNSITNGRTLMGTPIGTDQRFFLTARNGTWTMGINTSTTGDNNEFPIQAGWNLPCIEFNAETDKATLIVNTVRGTTESNPTQTGDSIKPYSSYTFAGNLTIGKANGFATSLSPGVVIDHFVYYPNVLTAQEMTDLYNSLITPSPPPPSSVRKQAAHQWERPYYKGGVAEALRVVNGDAQAVRGGFVDLVVQIDCEDDDCPSFSPRLHRSLDDGATYAQVNDLCGVTCFRGDSGDPDLVRGTVECCLTGALTENDGPTNFTTAAVPNITLSQDHSFTLRYKLKVDSSATPGQVIYYKVFDQNGNELEGGYTPALGAKLTVKDYANGGGF